jgi:two-component system KDP operon response regulator KdpE
MTTRVLVVDDEPQMRRLLRTSLEARGYAVSLASDGAGALQRAAAEQPDIVLLDLGLPDLDGQEVCRRLREWSQAPIIVLTVRDAEHDKVAALDAGADDYLTKPFGMDELMARIRAALRRVSPDTQASATVVETGGVQIDLAQRRVRVRGQEVHLTPTEYTLLQLLARNANRVLTHTALLREVWGAASEQDTPTLRVFITQLRHKVEPDPAHPSIIITEPGVGYRLRLDG